MDKLNVVYKFYCVWVFTHTHTHTHTYTHTHTHTHNEFKVNDKRNLSQHIVSWRTLSDIRQAQKEKYCMISFIQILKQSNSLKWRVEWWLLSAVGLEKWGDDDSRVQSFNYAG
jgi:hypothetical protein